MLIGETGDTYGFLLGGWRIHRTLTDRRLHQSAVLSGTVSITPRGPGDPQTAQYTEVGQLRIGSYRGVARRRLRCERQDDGTVVLAFEHGGRFVTCDLRSGRCVAAHECGDDRYAISWRVYARDLVAEEWRVRGPTKDYDAVTVLHRVRTPAASCSREVPEVFSGPV